MTIFYQLYISNSVISNLSRSSWNRISQRQSDTSREIGISQYPLGLARNHLGFAD